MLKARLKSRASEVSTDPVKAQLKSTVFETSTDLVTAQLLVESSDLRTCFGQQPEG